MARVVIVKSSVLTKYDRWDPGFYLEDPQLEEAVKKAEKRLKYAQSGLRTARKKVVENKKKVREMQEAGEVIAL